MFLSNIRVPPRHVVTRVVPYTQLTLLCGRVVPVHENEILPLYLTRWHAEQYACVLRGVATCTFTHTCTHVDSIIF